VAQGLIPGMSHSESAITRGKPQMILLPPTSSSFSVIDQLYSKNSWSGAVFSVQGLE
jgi:hypothetical protein